MVFKSGISKQWTLEYCTYMEASFIGRLLAFLIVGNQSKSFECYTALHTIVTN